MNVYGLKSLAFGTPGTSLEATPRDKYVLSEEEKVQLRGYFESFDYEKNGNLDKEELRYLLTALDFPMNSKQINEMLISLVPEAAKRGTVHLEEFETIMAEQYSHVDPIEDLKKSFRQFDHDSTGKITVENLREMADRMGENPTEADLSSLIDEFDVDEDGGLSLDEYLSIFEHHKITSKISVPNPSKNKKNLSHR